MSTLISAATGNFTSSGTWKVASAVASAEVDSEASSINLTNSNSDSGTFIAAVTQIDAIAIKISSIVTPTGTLTVTLRDSTAGTDAASVTINCSDLATGAAGWHVFSFSAVTPSGVNLFLVRVSRSVADSSTDRITIFASTASATNMAREVRLVTTGAPASGDKLIIAGEFTGAGAATSYTVTMNETATTSYGPTVSGGPPQGITVNNKATLIYGVAASTNYYLKMKGVLGVYAGGTFNIGTSGAKMPSTSTAVLEFDSAANVDTGLSIEAGGTFNAYGNPLTYVQAKLAANASAAATSLTTDVSTAWLNGDTIALAPTTRTATESESKALTADASTTTLTITAITNAHSGTSPTQGELGNLTRNVKIRGVSTSLQGYCLFKTTSTVVCQYVEFLQLGSATSNKRGIDATTTTGSCSITYCSVHDFIVASSLGFNITNSASNNITFSNNVVYNTASNSIAIASTTGTWTVDSNLFIRNTSGNCISLADAEGTLTNNTVAGSASNGIDIGAAAGSFGTWSGNTCHSNGNIGFDISANILVGTIGSQTCWRNSSFGIQVNGGSGVTFSSPVLFGNTTANLNLQGGRNSVFTNAILSGDSTFSTTSGLSFQTAGQQDAAFEDCTFGVASGIKVAHATQDILVSTSLVCITLRNCLLASTTEVSAQSSACIGSYIRSQKHDQTAGLHKTFTKYGTISIDAAIYDTTPSIRLTPNNASNKLATDGGSFDGKGSFQAAVANGATLTVSVKVRESVVGDGTDYNGARIRLIVKKNVAAGIAADTVLATATVASEGAFETISGTTASVTDDAVLSFIVDCDGTTGWVNVDTWTVTGNSSSLGNKYWMDGEPWAVGEPGGSAGMLYIPNMDGT